LPLLAQEAGAAAFAPFQDRSTGLAVSTNPLADQIGKAVLDKGGNAVDAAVAVGYALAVVHPAAGNIGGGGFAIVHMADGTNAALDFREKAPLAATRDMYLDREGNVIPDASTRGHKSAGVPGTVAGMSALLEKFGTRPLAELMAPAIRLAEKGYAVNEQQERSLAEFSPEMAKFPASRKYFLKADGSAYKAGETFVQKDLAKTLRLISREGARAFYQGAVADAIAKDMAANGGLVTREDLAKYSIVWREPARGTYRGYEILSMSPPSSGGTHIVQILNIMGKEDIKSLGFASAATIHIMAEAMRHAYADRSEYMGDPDFVKVPVEALTSASYADSIHEKIKKNADKATPSSEVRPGLPGREGDNTTHYSVVDKWGNAVSVTYTINESYGSQTAVNGAGFLLNNEMDDFAAKAGVPNIYGLVGSDANSIAPETRPLSTMSPTIVLKDGKLFLVLGSPGGSRIITTVLQVISNIVDHGMNISEAIAAPRIHMQWLPDELRTEPFGISKDTASLLTNMGYAVSEQPYMGDVNAIMVDPQSGVMYGSHDPRLEY
jgi:gamma-glutamyltranspeptidase/glutathione hydrolase